MVSPRDPSESYLVQTLLREGDAALYTVRGQPMPPEAELEYRHMTSIARWIEDGARP